MSDPSERAERTVLLTRMFDAYQQAATPSRIDTYLGMLPEHVPLVAIREGIRDAMAEVSEFPPGPGTVRRAVLACARMRPGDPPIEIPQQPSERIGPGAAPANVILGRFERRVEVSYQRVIERSREIRAERKLPDNLDARLWSLGEAERELGYVDSVVDRALERSLAAQRRKAGERLCASGALA